MTIRKANLETHQLCRSLLQKAVRRGCVSLIPKVVNHLVEVGDLDWLRNRVGVITFEECWPLGIRLSGKSGIQDIVQILSEVAICSKQKDAAGLGAMAYELFKGDFSVISDLRVDRPIKIVAEAISRPKEFWEWAKKNLRVRNNHFLSSALT